MTYTIPETIKEPFQQPPVGTLVVKVLEGREAMLFGGQKYGISFDVEVTEPDAAAGITDQVDFALGTNEDPGSLEERVKPETFTARGGRLERFCNAAGVDVRGQNLEVVLSEMKDRTLKGRTIAKKEPKVFEFGKRKGQENPYAGRYNIEWTQWMRADEGGDPTVQTTIAALMAAENNGSAGDRPQIPLPASGVPRMPSPPPPPAPSLRAPMPRTDRR
jgi:hypothetical protein